MNPFEQWICTMRWSALLRIALISVFVDVQRVTQRAAKGGGKLRGGGKHTVNSA